MPIPDGVIASSRRQTPDATVLQKLVGRTGSFYYEVVMMEESLKRWRSLQKEGRAREEELAHNRAIECFLLHYRNLRDFFYPSQSVWTNPDWFDNAVAWDFDTRWRLSSQDWKECTEREKERINKLLTHVSYSRAGLSHDWSKMPEMQKAILAALDQLVGMLPEDRKKWFVDLAVGS
jgi:hypothetical protein